VNSELENKGKSELIGIINSKDQDIKNLSKENKTLEQEKKHLEWQLKEMRRLIFGASKERFESINNPFQLTLPFEVLENTDTVQAVKEVASYQRDIPKKEREHHGRLPFPEHLPVEEIIVEPLEDTTGMVIIGKEITEELELIPSKLFVKRYIRPKYAKANNDAENTSVIIAELPSRPINKCMAGSSLLSHIMVSKFADHLPFYRQIEMFKREKVEIKSSTIDGWQTAICNLLAPLYDELKRQVLGQGYLQADESPIDVLQGKGDNEKSKTHQGYYWVYHSPPQKILFFDYRAGRGGDAPRELLKDFRGYLQTDGYSGYNQFSKREDMVMVGCMAHARRYFEKALKADELRASQMLTLMQKLYAVERFCRDANFNNEQRRKYRLQEAQPILEEMAVWIGHHQFMEMEPSNPLRKAIFYSSERWSNLCNYMFDGALEMDNNLIENKIRPMVIGRKNYLFAGSHNGAERAAMFYSFFGTCKMHNINPHKWLKYVLENINDWHGNKLNQLLPQNIILE
jgi:transposase